MSQSDGPRPADAVLVTGSSTGLGLETAVYLAERGLRVFATLRDLGRSQEVLQAAQQRGVEVEVLRLDVTDPQSIEAAVSEAVARTMADAMREMRMR